MGVTPDLDRKYYFPAESQWRREMKNKSLRHCASAGEKLYVFDIERFDFCEEEIKGKILVKIFSRTLSHFFF